MEIIDQLNQRAIDGAAAMDEFCRRCSPEAARIMLELARGFTGSPLGTGDGNVIRAQRLLEERLGK